MPGHNKRSHNRLLPSFLGMDAGMTSQLNEDLIRKMRGLLMCLAHVIDILSRGVCTTCRRQTSGRLVQELNVCNVCLLTAHMEHNKLENADHDLGDRSIARRAAVYYENRTEEILNHIVTHVLRDMGINVLDYLKWTLECYAFFM